MSLNTGFLGAIDGPYRRRIDRGIEYEPIAGEDDGELSLAERDRQVFLLGEIGNNLSILFTRYFGKSRSLNSGTLIYDAFYHVAQYLEDEDRGSLGRTCKQIKGLVDNLWCSEISELGYKGANISDIRDFCCLVKTALQEGILPEEFKVCDSNGKISITQTLRKLKQLSMKDFLNMLNNIDSSFSERIRGYFMETSGSYNESNSLRGCLRQTSCILSIMAAVSSHFYVAAALAIPCCFLATADSYLPQFFMSKTSRLARLCKNLMEISAWQMPAEPSEEMQSQVKQLLLKAARIDSKDITEFLSKRGVNLLSLWVPPPLLHVAAWHGSASVTSFLVEQNGFNVNQEHGVERRTPLHFAAYRDRKEIVEILLDKGANINSQDAQGDTPLHKAAGNLSLSAIHVLKTRGADQDIANNAGETSEIIMLRRLSELRDD